MKTFLRRLEILNYLRSQGRGLSTDEILKHLVDGGYMDDHENQARSMSRQVQRDLNFLLGEEFEEGEFENEFGLSRVRGDRKSQLWQLEPFQILSYDFERMPAFMALALSISQKHLRQVLPSGTQKELERVFSKAEQKLALQEEKLTPVHYQRLTDSVAFFQRGQKLEAPDFDMAVLDTIYRAILLGKRLRFEYQSQNTIKGYDIHPFGVAIMLPKLYLIGIKEEDISQGETKKIEPCFRSFLIHKVKEVEISPYANKVPDNFDLERYLNDGNMDVLLTTEDSATYALHLQFGSATTGNLINDLRESPVSSNQKLEQDQQGQWHLKASVKRTVQLRNWLVSLGPHARIISPEIIRSDLLSYLEAIQQNYSSR